LHRIRAITLDLDNTLWEIDPVIHRAEQSLWAWLEENYPRIPEAFSADDVLTLREVVIEKYWQHKGHDFRFLRKKVLELLANEAGYDKSLVEPAFKVFDDVRNEVELYPDVLPDLELLFERYTVVAVTNGNANLETIGIRHLFHDVVTAVDAGAAKPAQRIFDVAIRRCGVAAREILHVGDHPETDIVGGRQAGMRTAWVNRTDEEWPDHLQEADIVVTSISELREILERAA
jgi:FMN hydrolase / 5-amino-6-(5-phospho-D-ribitylamino)uracil phosphatase